MLASALFSLRQRSPMPASTPFAPGVSTFRALSARSHHAESHPHLRSSQNRSAPQDRPFPRRLASESRYRLVTCTVRHTPATASLVASASNRCTRHAQPFRSPQSSIIPHQGHHPAARHLQTQRGLQQGKRRRDLDDLLRSPRHHVLEPSHLGPTRDTLSAT